MEMEINLQDYVDVILRHWRVVLVVFLTATVVATVVSFVQPSTYEASVTLVEETYEFSAGPELQLSDRTVVKLYPTLARTEAVERRVVDELEPVLSPAEKTPSALLTKVTVRGDKDNPALFEITVRADDPDKAVQIANTWAEQYLQVASGLGVGWTSQLEVVEQTLESAEEELATFERQSGLGLVLSQEGDGTCILLGPRGLEFERRALALAEHRQAHNNLLLLLDKARQAKEASGAIEDLPLQLLNTLAITDRGQLSVDIVREQRDLDTLIQMLEDEEGIVAEVVDELATEVEQLQEGLVRDKLELERLTRARDLAEGSYTALANKIQESQLFRNSTQILSEAGRAKPVGRSPWLNVIAAGVWGLLVGIMLALGLEYLRRRRATSAK
jgi:capsular polysaccharide biosynthesis protein